MMRDFDERRPAVAFRHPFMVGLRGAVTLVQRTLLQLVRTSHPRPRPYQTLL